MPSDSINLCWVDGEVLPGNRAVVRADDSAFREGRGCLTTLRIAAGQPRFVNRHIVRLQDGAKALRLGEVAEATIRRAMAKASFDCRSVATLTGQPIWLASRASSGRIRASGPQSSSRSRTTAPRSRMA
jgi:branched-subunit amino acid aminotransferase/4-amino-4-deoxychorismate lyase